MKFELDLVRAGKKPVPDGVAEIKQSVTMSRRDIRLISDEVIGNALLKNDLPSLAASCCGLMLTVAKAVDDHDIEPDVPDFIEAAQALIEDARAVIDRGLQIDRDEVAKVGAVMVELTVRGICAALNFPYDDLMRAVAAGLDVREVLVASGHVKPLFGDIAQVPPTA
jgi:hypothetical protein